MRMNAEHFFRRVNPAQWDQDYYDRTLKHVVENVIPKCTPEGPWLAGGAIRRMVTGQSIMEGDFDIFFKNEDQYREARQFLLDRKAYWNNDKDHVDEFTVTSLDNTKYKIQLIKMKYYIGTMDLIDDFDFTVCQAAYDGVTVTHGDWFLFDNARKRLAVNKIKYPVAVLRRLLKYQKQGYYACNGCLQEITEAIHKMPPEDFLKHQVLYVD